jgi:hypothetical protein
MGTDSQCLVQSQALCCGGSWPAEAAGWATKGKGLEWPGALRLPPWHAILAMLAGLCLLLAFHQVVLGAVQQGELRRKATAMQAEAASRCNALSGTRSREICLLQLNATPTGRDRASVAAVRL